MLSMVTILYGKPRTAELSLCANKKFLCLFISSFGLLLLYVSLDVHFFYLGLNIIDSLISLYDLGLLFLIID